MSDLPGNDDLSPTEQARIEAEMRAKFDALGLGPPTKFADESLAPPINESCLFGIVSGEIQDEETGPIYRLIFTYKSWYDAYVRIEREYLRDV